MVDHAFSYIAYGKCMVYHGLPVSKHHGILPWCPCFETQWHTTPRHNASTQASNSDSVICFFLRRDDAQPQPRASNNEHILYVSIDEIIFTPNRYNVSSIKCCDERQEREFICRESATSSPCSAKDDDIYRRMNFIFDFLSCGEC